MQSKTCQYCRYYTPDREPDFDASKPGLGVFVLKDSATRGTCACPAFVYREDDVCPIDGLEYGDAEGYSASFAVGPRFGCVHFTPRQAIGLDYLSTVAPNEVPCHD